MNGNNNRSEIERELIAKIGQKPDAEIIYHVFGELTGVPPADSEADEIGRIEFDSLLEQEQKNFFKKVEGFITDYNLKKAEENPKIQYGIQLEKNLYNLFIGENKDKQIVKKTIEVLINPDLVSDSDISFDKSSLKSSLEEYILNYLQNINQQISFDFKSKFKNSHKCIMPLIARGIANIKGTLPKEFLQCMTPWEQSYFLAKIPDKIEISSEISLDNITKSTLKAIYFGMQKLYFEHSIAESKGKLKTQLELPEYDAIDENYKKVFNQFQIIF